MTRLGERTRASLRAVVGQLGPALLVALLTLSPRASFAQSIGPLDPSAIDADHDARDAPRTTRPTLRPADFDISEDLALPPLPEEFEHDVRTSDGTAITWEYPSRSEASVAPLREVVATALPRLRSELGLTHSLPPIRIRVATNPDAMRALAPADAPPPPYAVGVAYPGLDLILLTFTAPETWQRPDLAQVLVHELSHVVLHHALEPDGEASTRAPASDVPLWFVEGVAIHQAHERSLERVETLWRASLSGQIFDLDHLDRRFPQRPHQVDLAYAQSADFVAWLLRRSGPSKLGDMMGRMRHGQRFEVAVSQTWSAGIGQLEVEWRESLAERFGLLPMFATGGAGWVVVGVLVVMAWRRRKARSAEIVRRWEREDAQREAVERALRRARVLQLQRERRARLEALAAQDARLVEGAGDGDDASGDDTSEDASDDDEARAAEPAAVVVLSSRAPDATTSSIGRIQLAPGGASIVRVGRVAPPDGSASSSEEPAFDEDLDPRGRPIH